MLLASVGVRTGAAIVREGETGVLEERQPPRRQSIANDDDADALDTYMEGIARALTMDRRAIRDRAASEFGDVRIEPPSSRRSTSRESQRACECFPCHLRHVSTAVPSKNLIRVSWQGFGSIAARPPERVDCPLYQRARSRKWVSLER